MDFNQLTVLEIVEKIKQKEIDLIELNKYFIKNVKDKESKVNAFAYFDEEKWLDQARKLSTIEPGVYSDLLGIPVGIKDIFNTADMPTSMGSPIWKGFTPGNDARVVHNIRFHKGIIAGKTVTAEFAVHVPNETKNPWDGRFSPGTSSSGSAAAVSCRMVPLSLGTQTAGSVIRPSSYCGIYGFKPSFGTIPRTAMLKTTDSLDTIGLFATNVDDCKLLFDVIRVHGLDYPIVHEKLNDEALQLKKGGAWKVGIVFDQHWTYEHISDYAKEKFQLFINDIVNYNTEISFPKFDELFQNSHRVQETIYHKALSYYFKKEFENQTLISPVMYEIVETGRKISLDEYKEALAMQDKLQHFIDGIFGEYDILIALSTAGTAPEFGTAIDPPDTCLIWTMCGLPAMNIPMFIEKGLPFGIQIIGRKYSDYKLVSFAKEMVQKGLFPKFSQIPKI